jgi:hypothetical protein
MTIFEKAMHEIKGSEETLGFGCLGECEGSGDSVASLFCSNTINHSSGTYSVRYDYDESPNPDLKCSLNLVFNISADFYSYAVGSF